MAKDFDRSKIKLGRLLAPHFPILTIGFAAVIIEGITNLAEPWPLKLVIDAVLKNKADHSWLHELIFAVAGTEKLAVLRFACIAVIVIAALGAISNYTQK
jgi:subfamily B ATP-binding cassette protein MsbA